MWQPQACPERASVAISGAAGLGGNLHAAVESGGGTRRVGDLMQGLGRRGCTVFVGRSVPHANLLQRYTQYRIQARWCKRSPCVTQPEGNSGAHLAPALQHCWPQQYRCPEQQQQQQRLLAAVCAGNNGRLCQGSKNNRYRAPAAACLPLWQHQQSRETCQQQQEHAGRSHGAEKHTQLAHTRQKNCC